jgi:hypothetical protein
MNETVDLDAPRPFPQEVRRALKTRGYKVSSQKLINKMLKDEGIKDAGQINAIPDKELGETVKAQALLFTTVTSWETVYLAAYASVAVGARFDLVDAKTSELIWMAEDTITDRRLGLDKKTAQRTLAFAALQTYEPLVTRLVNKTFRHIPNGPFASKNLPSHHREITAEDVDSAVRNIHAIIQIIEVLTR